MGFPPRSTRWTLSIPSSRPSPCLCPLGQAWLSSGEAHRQGPRSTCLWTLCPSRGPCRLPSCAWALAGVLLAALASPAPCVFPFFGASPGPVARVATLTFLRRSGSMALPWLSFGIPEPEALGFGRRSSSSLLSPKSLSNCFRCSSAASLASCASCSSRFSLSRAFFRSSSENLGLGLLFVANILRAAGGIGGSSPSSSPSSEL